MRKLYALGIGVLIALSTSAGTAAAADPVDSNTALSGNGGGCYSPLLQTLILQDNPFDLLNAVNPEWAPVVNGSSPFSAPVLVHGRVADSHVSQQDFPAGHVRYDQNTDIALDATDQRFLATGNRNGLLELEWESGSYPAWAWAGGGDRIVALGRWIFDCGHPDPIPGHKAGSNTPCITAADPPAGVACVGAIFNYRSEMHPPQAVAVIRSGRAAQLGDDGRAVPVTQADVFVSPDGGGAGDVCVVTHKPSVQAILGAPCFPLSAPLALIPIGGRTPLNSSDFEFDVPLPAVPGGRDPVLRVLRRDATAVPANLQVTPQPGGFHVKVLMTQPVGGHLPTGFAATLLAGFLHAPASPLVHLRVKLEGVVVNNALKPTVPGVVMPAGWKMQANVNGSWQEVGGLDGVGGASVGQFVATPAVFDLFLPRSSDLTLHIDAASKACVDTLFGQSLLTDLIRFGFNPADPKTLPGALELGLACLNATESDAGSVEASFAAPTFGVSDSEYDLPSSKGAYTLRFRIERAED